MRAPDGRRPCQEARAYYYDLLCPDEADVPLPVRQHVATCPFCREQMGRLRETLFALELHPDGSDPSQDETIETLAEQFRLLDERVTCSDARSCLPQLAMAAPQIRIPTPVTVHVDQCPQCAKDLATLRKLQLTTDQLRRLSQLFASQKGGEVLPWHVQSGDIAPAEPRPTSGSPGHETLSPVAPQACRAKGVVIACHDVSAADIFDAVVPFGAPRDQRQKAIGAHLQACPVCLARARKLHHTISKIVERADSKIETVYHAPEDAEDASPEIREAYQYPVRVEVVHADSDAACDPDDSRGILPRSLRRLQGPVASLARVAVIGTVIVALATLVRTTVPTASGTSIGQVRKAVEKAPNVHVTVTDHLGKLVQEALIAHRSNRLVHRTPQGCVVYDVGRGLKQTIQPRAAIGATLEISKHERDWARQVMANCLLDVLERVAPDTPLHSAVDCADKETGVGLNVYELQRSQRAEDSLVQDRWWAYLDPGTGLPRKMEFYRRRPSDREWQLKTTTTYTYPAEQEMDDSIRALLTAN